MKIKDLFYWILDFSNLDPTKNVDLPPLHMFKLEVYMKIFRQDNSKLEFNV